MYIILGSNSYHQVQAFGTPKNGVPFRTEQAAEKQRRKIERERPGLDWLVLPLTALPLKEEE